MKKAVVLGGAGFVGKRLVEMLLDEAPNPAWPVFDEVHVFDQTEFDSDLIIQKPRNEGKPTLTVTRGNICSLGEVEEVVAGAHTVFHMASMVYVGLKRNTLIDRVNIEGTKNVISACQSHGVPYLIYTSSEDVVLSKKPIQDGDESIPYPEQFVHDYVRTKVEGEKLALAADGQSGVRTCSLRPVHIYGPRDPHALIPSLLAFKNGSVPFLLGSGRAKFDFVFVDNVVHAHLLAAKGLENKMTREQIGGEAFFIGEGNCQNYFDWLKPYAASKGIRMPGSRLPYTFVGVLAGFMEFAHRITGTEVPFHRFHQYVLCLDFYFSNEKAESRLGYKPIVTPETGYKRTLNWLDGITL